MMRQKDRKDVGENFPQLALPRASAYPYHCGLRVRGTSRIKYRYFHHFVFIGGFLYPLKYRGRTCWIVAYPAWVYAGLRVCGVVAIWFGGGRVSGIYGYGDEVAPSWVQGIVERTVMGYCASHIWWVTVIFRVSALYGTPQVATTDLYIVRPFPSP